MSIKDWQAGERPREKLLQRGAAALSDAELLAVLLRSGTAGISAVDMARALLSRFGGLGGVMHAPFAALSQQKGMGLAAWAQFAVVMEIGRRVLGEELRQADAFASPQAAGDYLRLRLGRETVEVCTALFLNSQNQMLACEELSRGTVAENTVYVREVAARALAHHAAAVIIAHNHPSGCTEPSAADHAFTARLQAALQLLDIVLLDHFIITAQAAVSFAARGWLKAAQAA